MRFEANCLATTIGSMPHTSADDALDLVLRSTPEVPGWPQLPKRSFLENMYLQFSELLPGAMIQDGKIRVDTGHAANGSIEKLYEDYIDANVERYLPSSERAMGLGVMLERLKGGHSSVSTVKGQVTGPISLGLQVTDLALRPLLYDDVWSDIVAKHLHMVAAAEEAALANIWPSTVVFLDEPYLHAYGSAFFSLSRERVIDSLEEVFGGLGGLKGVHCCGNTDWGVVLSTSVDVLSFDAYRYAETLSLYPEAVDAFMARDGVIAWGIVPDDGEFLANESVASLLERLEAAMEMLVKKGIPKERLLSQSLITPSCGLGGQSIAIAERACALLAGVSAEMRSRFFGEVRV